VKRFGNLIAGFDAALQPPVIQILFRYQARKKTTPTAAQFYFGVMPEAAKANSGGSNNTFVGEKPALPTATAATTVIGSFTKYDRQQFQQCTAFGARAQVLQNNSLVLGSITGVNGASADTSVAIGTTQPKRGWMSERSVLVGSPVRESF